MPLLLRRSSFFPVLVLVSFFSVVYYLNHLDLAVPTQPVGHTRHHRPKQDLPSDFRWKDVLPHYPVESFASLPTGAPNTIPKIQHDFPPEMAEDKAERQRRLSAVKEAFLHSWEGYKKHAWLQDEVTPISGHAKNTLGGWGATLVDSLDTLWIMGLEKEFVTAVHSIKYIDFTITELDSLNVFETTIRYLGGLLSAYDISGQVYDELLEKAVELGEMLYFAFDTPNRLPVTRWDWRKAALGKPQEANQHSLLAEIGSLTLEFTRLTQLTNDPKYYDAVARITNELSAQQNNTKLPGLWPVLLDALNTDFTKDRTFTLGGMADSTYEYLPKQHLLLAGAVPQYETMYTTALAAAKQHLFFRPLNPQNHPLLLPGTTHRNSAANIRFLPEGQHLSCFVGGMVALGSRIFSRPEDLETARQLTDACVWAYESTPTGIMPEVFRAAACQPEDDCAWREEKWFAAVSRQEQGEGHSRFHQPPPMTDEEVRAVVEGKRLPAGFTAVEDPRYLLRPEAVESLFVLWRVTGERYWVDKAWGMFEAVVKVARTEVGFAGVRDVRDEDEGGGEGLLDSMESFWTAETLKYFWLLFAEPEVVSLDNWVLNTEAHPFRRPG